MGGNWQVTLRHSTAGEMRTTLDFRFSSDYDFNAHSHRKAVKNMVGGFKAGFAKVFSKKPMLRTGAFVNLTGGKATLAGGKVVFSGLLDFVVAPALSAKRLGKRSAPYPVAQCEGAKCRRYRGRTRGTK